MFQMSKWAIRAHFKHLHSKSFPMYKEYPLSFDHWNCYLKFRESTGTPSPKMGVALGVWGFTPSQFPTLSKVCDVTPELSLGPHPCNLFALVTSPKLRLWHSRPHNSAILETKAHLGSNLGLGNASFKMTIAMALTHGWFLIKCHFQFVLVDYGGFKL
jgi:hypothetical protein